MCQKGTGPLKQLITVPAPLMWGFNPPKIFNKGISAYVIIGRSPASALPLSYLRRVGEAELKAKGGGGAVRVLLWVSDTKLFFLVCSYEMVLFLNCEIKRMKNNEKTVKSKNTIKTV